MDGERKMLKPAANVKRDRVPDWVLEERQRMAAVLASATVPPECGGRIIPAPGRGPFKVEPQVELVPQGKDGWARKDGGYAGWTPIRGVDVFDLMIAGARRRREPAPLTAGQIAIGRHYQGLVQRHDAGGIRGTRLDGGVSGGTGMEFMDAYLAEGREIEALRRRIGTSAAMAVRRVRPSVRGGADRCVIPDRVLVDMVCLGERSLSQVLIVHGWAKSSASIQALTQALSAALDRMIGYRGEKTS